MQLILETFRRNRTQTVTVAAIVVFFLLAANGMETQDWVVTVLRGLAVAAVTFLVASGFSLIFGLMDVLNLAHGTLFMIGAYIAWSVYLRPDTMVDVATPLALLAAGVLLAPLAEYALARWQPPSSVLRFFPWIALALGIVVLFWAFPQFPVAMWDVQKYDASPVIYSAQLDTGKLVLPANAQAEPSAVVTSGIGVLLAGALIAVGLAAFGQRNRFGTPRWTTTSLAAPIILAVLGLGAFVANEALTQALLDMGTTWRFVISVIVATLVGAGLGALMESSLIRPLYARPIYQLMLTLGLGVIGREIVIAIWGRTQITMAKPDLFANVGKGCPAQNVSDWLANGCSTINFMGSRIRTYNEIFVILIGIVVLILVWILLQKSRIGMVIRAGVQDREMVEALGTNVRRVFTFVFALGVGLAALGGALAGPFMGVADSMGESLLLSALIALAIGGLTSFPGAAAGSLLVGLMQQFIVKYGQIGIQLPFMAQPFKPTPPLVPASTVLLMVIILLVMPQGLFGRKE